jgi:5,10-methylenetetrahydrofolate reductase
MKAFRERVFEAASGKGKPLVAYEVSSPRGSNVASYVNNLKGLGLEGKVDAVNVFDNPTSRVRVDPMAYGHKILVSTKLDVIVHAKTRDMTLKKFQSWMFGLHALGIKNVLVMSGDPPTVGDYPTEESIFTLNPLEANTGIKKYLNRGKLMPDVPTRQQYLVNRYHIVEKEAENPTDFFVGNVILPLRGNEAVYTASKTKSGADFFQTQISYDAESTVEFFRALVRETEKQGLKPIPPILLGTAPIKSPKMLDFFAKNIPFVKVPDNMVKKVKSAKDAGEASVEECLQFYAGVRDSLKSEGIPLALGYHVMALGADDLAKKIVDGVLKL